MRNSNIIHKGFSCTRDGLKIRGTMFRPACPTPLPIVIVSHEFMMNRLTTLRYAYMFAKMGYAAFCYDFNGGGEISQSQGKSTAMSVKTEVKDLKAVIDFAKTQEYTDGSHLTLMGCSQGGFVSAIVAAEYGVEQVERLILFYPALSIPDDARKGSMIFARFDPQNVPKTLFCGPIILGRQYVLDVLNMDPFEIISKYRGPVLLVHGDFDHIVDHSYSEKAYEAYKKADEEALAAGEIAELPQLEFKTIHHGEHMFPVPTHMTDALNTVKEFVNGNTEVAEVDVRLSGLRFGIVNGRANLSIPFKGKATGKIFNGSVKDGASDERYYKLGKPSDICADYIISGKDKQGNDIEIHVQNRNVADGWKPSVKAKGKSVEFFNHTESFAQLRQRGLKGPLVRLFVPYEDANK